jgi:hypothetical protein
MEAVGILYSRGCPVGSSGNFKYSWARGEGWFCSCSERTVERHGKALPMIIYNVDSVKTNGGGFEVKVRSGRATKIVKMQQSYNVTKEYKILA